MSDRPTTAVVLAAGAGRRLSPLTNRRPKPMVPVANRPLLEYVIEAASAAGVDEVALVVGYERERIQTHFGDGDDWDVSIRYVVQEKRLGTAHAVAQAEPHVDGPFLVLNGDRIVEPSAVADVRDALADGDAAAAMAVTRSDRPRAYGVVTVRDGFVETIVEKPRRRADSDVINAGVYAFTPAVFDAIRDTEASDDGEYELPDTVERLIDEGGVRAVRYGGGWHDVSYLWDLLAVTDDVIDRDGGTVAGTLAPGAGVDDRCVVAPTASVGRNAVVGAGTTLGANARIGPNATVERSVVFPDATVEAGAVVRDCVVGAGARVGANATVRGGTATVAVAGELHEGVRLGGVVGDDAAVGGATALAPGTVLGNDAVVGDGASVSGRIEDGVTVRRG
ncbi:sugar phosphate nucleotidyltransferase [Halorubrum sp. F4]|uniref:sugar phosphate nucleotidyltransferase n=1 Tax=Halorubrum sp. F4 TaxID=2989715 RepID=UPI0024815C76|nr:sugar phosphate nucleotidyltransferase [Halorubrum sp. F4]